MVLKEDWKNTGKGIGHAFKNFGKAVKTSVEREYYIWFLLIRVKVY